MRVIGLDPGLGLTGWGIIETAGTRLSHVAHGVLASDRRRSTAERLVQLHDALREVITAHRPEAAAVEMSLVNRNPTASLKLGLARGVALLTPAEAGLPVQEYLPTMVKKAVVGTGKATKEQVEMMVRRLLPGLEIASADAADALAVAICHAHHAATGAHWHAAADTPPRAAGGLR